MPTISPTLLPILMLFASNVFMTFAWYGHLKFKESLAAARHHGELGHRLLRILAGGAGQPLGQRGLFGGPAQTMQEVITLVVFAGFSVLYLKEPLGWNHALGFA